MKSTSFQGLPAVALLLPALILGLGCSGEPSVRAEKEPSPKRQQVEGAVFGAVVEHSRGVAPPERVISGEGAVPQEVPVLQHDPAGVLPIVLELQEKTSGKSIEISYMISKKGETSNCRVVSIGGSEELKSVVVLEEERRLCEAIEQRRYAPTDTTFSVTVQFGTPHYE